jgi:hypothetical protein
VVGSGTGCHKVAVSVPDKVIQFFNLSNPSNRTMVLGLTQPLTEMNTKNLTWVTRRRRVRLTTSPLSVNQLSKIYVLLDGSQLRGPLWPPIWIALIFNFQLFYRLQICMNKTVNSSYDVKNCVFWDVTPCGSSKNRRFGGT